MDMLVIRGGQTIRGAVRAGGAKNAALPIMAASLLTDGNVCLKRVPDWPTFRHSRNSCSRWE